MDEKDTEKTPVVPIVPTPMPLQTTVKTPAQQLGELYSQIISSKLGEIANAGNISPDSELNQDDMNLLFYKLKDNPEFKIRDYVHALRIGPNMLFGINTDYYSGKHTGFVEGLAAADADMSTYYDARDTLMGLTPSEQTTNHTANEAVQGLKQQLDALYSQIINIKLNGIANDESTLPEFPFRLKGSDILYLINTLGDEPGFRRSIGRNYGATMRIGSDRVIDLVVDTYGECSSRVEDCSGYTEEDWTDAHYYDARPTLMGLEPPREDPTVR